MPKNSNHNFDFNSIYEKYVISMLRRLSGGFGEPASLVGAEYDEVLTRMKKFRELYVHMSFWLIVDLRIQDVLTVEGADPVLYTPLRTLRDFLKLVHPDYLIPYLTWANATYEFGLQNPALVVPMQISQRITLPLLTRDGQYHWFAQHGTVLQVDSSNRLIQHMNTYYDEGKWTRHGMQPMEAYFSGRHNDSEALQKLLNAKMVPYVIDEFTNAELDLLTLYAAGETAERITILKNWTKHTLHEYNANVIQKARRIFQYNFPTARDFADYCVERGFIQARHTPT